MQTKTMRYLLERQTNNIKSWQGCRKIETFIHVGMPYGTATLEDSLAIFYKVKHTLTNGPAPYCPYSWIFTQVNGKLRFKQNS